MTSGFTSKNTVRAKDYLDNLKFEGDGFASFGHLHIPENGGKNVKDAIVDKRASWKADPPKPPQKSFPHYQLGAITCAVGLLAINILFLSGVTFSTDILAGVNIGLSIGISVSILCLKRREEEAFIGFIAVAFLLSSVALNGCVFVGLQNSALYQLFIAGGAGITALLNQCSTPQTDLEYT